MYFSGRKAACSRVHDGDGREPQQLIFEAGAGGPDLSCDTRFVEAGYLAACRDFLRRRFDAGTRTIEQSREQVLKFFADNESTSHIQQ